MSIGTNAELSQEQLANVVAVALSSTVGGERRPLTTYEPLGWLLQDEIKDRRLRRSRRLLYRKLVRGLAAEFDAIYSERLMACNGPWDFAAIYTAIGQGRKCIWRMHWYAFQHGFHLPGARAGSSEAYRRMMKLLAQH